MKWLKISGIIALGTILAVLTVGPILAEKFPFGRYLWYPYYLKIRGKRTVKQVIAQYGNQVRARLQPSLAENGFQTFPKQLALLVFKQEMSLEVWGVLDSQWKKITAYPLTAKSGTIGPKLREGDGQIPEGSYCITLFHPNSSYHLSLKLNYPNAFDTMMAQQDGRTRLGSNIFIHGKASTIGCVPIGDRAIEDVFFLVYQAGLRNVQVVIAPSDLRIRPTPPDIPGIEWDERLYDDIKQALQEFRGQPLISDIQISG